jgi:aryl-alcohol dehydrogenase-like predicted oxidoreductase
MAGQLPTATLGRTGLEVTRLGFGCALWRPDKPHWTEEQAGRVWGAALDAGINFFDTAYDYIYSEEWMGRSLASRYDEFHLATKGGCIDDRPADNGSTHLWTRENIFRGIETSLKRLGRDRVDILQLHNPTVDDVEAGGIVNALNDIRTQGMTRWIGVSTTLPHLPAFLESGAFDVMQIPYSALQREHEEWITKAAQAGVGIIIRGGVAQGEAGVGRGASETWSKFEEARLDELLEEGESRSAFVLRFTLAHPDIHTTIVGTTRLEHLQENLDAAIKGPLSDEVYAEAKRRLDAAGESPAPVE